MKKISGRQKLLVTDLIAEQGLNIITASSHPGVSMDLNRLLLEAIRDMDNLTAWH